VTNQGTVAEGIAIAAPARQRQILAAVRDTGGAILAVPEAAIVPARRTLAARGFYVEPTAAINWAGYEMARAQGLLDDETPVVIPLCGAGIKAGAA
jgi:threonine synthase